MVDRALELEPHSLQANYLQAKLIYRQGNYEKALNLLENAAVGHPPAKLFSTYYSLLGNVHHKMGHFEEAFYAFQQANRIDAASSRCMKLQILNQNDLKMIGQMSRWFCADRINKWNRRVKPDEPQAPAFLVGFPRSGTTLLEQVLKCVSH